ncbi:MAG: enoyl-CoA hydratase/isomerase family protein, partial [Deltaproteobacteria bacterium]|nr:enoyl-CoA hydratase/isomerase family protein [Candidatus Tharpellaceae bacterium]
ISRMADTIKVTHREKVATITLNRPQQFNVFTTSMVIELENELALIRDDHTIRAVLLVGSGKAFCAGVDIQEKPYNPLNSRIFLKTFNRVVKMVESLPQPTVAVLHGTAVAGGLELALACTFRIAAREAKMGLPEINLGLVAAVGTTYRLPRLVGFGKAMEMCLLGSLITGSEAERIGLVNWTFPAKNLGDEAELLVKKLVDQPPIAMSLVKDALCAAATPHETNDSLMEILSASVNHYTEDKKEGLAAFLAKRKPDFSGQ